MGIHSELIAAPVSSFDAAGEIELVDGTRGRAFDLDVGRAVGHRLVDVAHRHIAVLVLGVDHGAFHLGEGQRGALQRGVAVGFEEGGGLFHARLELHPFGLAVVGDLGEARIVRIFGHARP